MNQRILGIMICEQAGNPPFTEHRYYRRLTRIGERYGLRVFVFSPLRIQWDTLRIRGYQYCFEKDQWVESSFPLPDLIYDRSFYSDPRQRLQSRRELGKLAALGMTAVLGRGVKDKWAMHRLLHREPALRRRLPLTRLYTGPARLLQCLSSEGRVLIKPIRGQQGKGILLLTQTADRRFVIQGKLPDNRDEYIFTAAAPFVRWLTTHLKPGRCIIQQYLSLTADNGRPFDVRALVQKNGNGEWALTGTAVRLGPPNRLTSNLHGGGTALATEPFLQQVCGNDPASSVVEKIGQLCRIIPSVVEGCCGRLVELGIDFGVDRDGKVWILEVNSKPGRRAFTMLPYRRAGRLSHLQPIRYARYLLDRHIGG